ncbi:MAG: pilin [Pseudomonadota bacterium]
MKTQNLGFTLIEMLVVVGVLAILVLLALPSYQGKLVRDQIIEGSALAKLAKDPIAAQWTASKTLPVDNASVPLPAPDNIVNNLVRAVTVQDGAIHITYGNRANGHLKDKILTLRPAVVEDAQIVPVTWVCGFATGPDKTTTFGENKTSISKEYLPINCR